LSGKATLPSDGYSLFGGQVLRAYRAALRATELAERDRCGILRFLARRKRDQF
jgi:hypothetical protein